MILLFVVAWRRGSREKGSCEGVRRMWEERGGCGGVKVPSCDAIISWSESQRYLELPRLYHSHPSAVKLRTRICFTGRAYLYSGTCFNSLASCGYECEYAFASRVCDISCAADHVMKFPRPSPSIFCILQVIKHWRRRRRPGNEATNTWSGHTYACGMQGMMWICIPSTHHTVLCVTIWRTDFYCIGFQE